MTFIAHADISCLLQRNEERGCRIARCATSALTAIKIMTTIRTIHVLPKNANIRRFLHFKPLPCHFFRIADDFEIPLHSSDIDDLQIRRSEDYAFVTYHSPSRNSSAIRKKWQPIRSKTRNRRQFENGGTECRLHVQRRLTFCRSENGLYRTYYAYCLHLAFLTRCLIGTCS